MNPPDPATGAPAIRRHAVIAGTGRAGTTFLVQFLAACGLEAGSAAAEGPERDLGHARAGLEHYLLDDDAPYVVKDPWLFAYCDEIDLDLVAIDALIVPTRDLLASAASRTYQERIALVGTDWRSRPVVDVRGGAEGGAVYSLDPVDQARILAVGFHRLVHWATKHQIPLFLLDFPRIVHDGDYLVSALSPWLQGHCPDSTAHAAFAKVAEPAAVRFDDHASERTTAVAPEAFEVERRALSALLDQRDAELHAAHRSLAEARTAHEGSSGEALELRAALADTAAQLERCEQALAEATAGLEAMCASRSWRATAVLRALRSR